MNQYTNHVHPDESHGRIGKWGDYSPITSSSIANEEKGVWNTAFEVTAIGKKPFEVNLSKPLPARKFRLSIEAEGRSALAEFQLFCPISNQSM